MNASDRFSSRGTSQLKYEEMQENKDTVIEYLASTNNTILAFQVAAFVATTYNAIHIPLELGFASDMNAVAGWNIWICISWVLELGFAFRLHWLRKSLIIYGKYEQHSRIAHSTRQIHDPEKLVDTQSWSTLSKHYKQYSKMEMGLLFPLDIIFLVIASAARIPGSMLFFAGLRLLKLARILHFASDFVLMLHTLKRRRTLMTNDRSLQILHSVPHIAQTAIYRQYILFAGLLATSHWFACLFSFVTYLNCDVDLSLCDSTNSMAVADKQIGVTRIRRYGRFIYYAMVTLVTTGFGDIVPLSTIETCLVICMMAVGMLFSTAIIAGFARIYFEKNLISSEFNRVSDEMQQYMHELQLPHALCARIRSYLAYCLTVQGGANDVQILNTLPSHLRNEVVETVQGHVVLLSRLFCQCSPQLCRELSRRMTALLFSPADTIINGQVDEMYIVLTGRVGAVKQISSTLESFHNVMGASGNLPTVYTVGRGETFNEKGVLSMSAEELQLLSSVNQFVAMKFSQVLKLTRGDMDEVLASIYNGMEVISLKAYLIQVTIQLDQERVSAKPSTRRKMSIATSSSSFEGLSERVPSGPRENIGVASAYSSSVQLGQLEALSRRRQGALGRFFNAIENIEAGIRDRVYYSGFRLSWNVIAFLFTVLQIFILPIQLAFLRPEGMHSHPFTVFVRSFNVLSDWFFVIDLVLRVRYFRIQQQHQSYGELVRLRQIKGESEASIIWQQYFSTRYAAIDIIATLPLDVMGHYVFGIDYYVDAIYGRLLRMVRIFRLVAYFESVQSILAYFQIVIVSTTLTLLRLSFRFLTVVHWGGCIWYLLAAPPNGYTNSREYISGDVEFTECLEYQVNGDKVCTWLNMDRIASDDVSMWVKYIRAIYWALVTITTVGYGDIRPSTTAETYFAFLWVYISGVVQYASIGALATAISERYTRVSEFRRENTSVYEYLAHKNIPVPLRRKVKLIQDFQWHQDRGIDKEQLVSILPQEIRQSISVHKHQRLFRSISLFANAPREILSAIATKTQHQVWLEGDFIARRGEPFGRLFTIERGRVEVIREVCQNIDVGVLVLEKGMHYGGWSLFAPKELFELIDDIQARVSSRQIAQKRRLTRQLTRTSKALLSSSGGNQIQTDRYKTLDVNLVARCFTEIHVLNKRSVDTIRRQYESKFQPILQSATKVLLEHEEEVGVLQQNFATSTKLQKLIKHLGKEEPMYFGREITVKPLDASGASERASFVVSSPLEGVKEESQGDSSMEKGQRKSVSSSVLQRRLSRASRSSSGVIDFFTERRGSVAMTSSAKSKIATFSRVSVYNRDQFTPTGHIKSIELPSIQPQFENNFVCLPGDWNYEIWNILAMFSNMYQLWRVPYRIAFSKNVVYEDRWLSLYADTFLFIDAVARSTFIAYIDNGDIVTELKLIRKNYFRKAFWFDLVYVSPVPYLAWLVIPESGWTFWVCHLPRLMGITKIQRQFESLIAFALIRFKVIYSYFFLLCRIIFLLTLIAHYCAAVYYSISESNMHCRSAKEDVFQLFCDTVPVGFVSENNNSNWIVADGLRADDSNKDLYVLEYHRWLRAFYASLSTLTVVCYGDITPRNTLESGVIFTIVFVGVGVLSSLLNNIVELVELLMEKDAATRLKVDTFNRYAIATNIPTSLRKRVMDYYAFVRETTGGLNEAIVLRELPLCMRIQIRHEVLSYVLDSLLDVLEKITLRRQGSNLMGILELLTQRLQPCLYLPRDTILREGEKGKELYILQHGRIDICVTDDLVVVATISGSIDSSERLLENSIFGELAFFQTDTRRLATVRAASYCEVLKINKEEWDDVVPSSRYFIDLFCHERRNTYIQAHANIVANVRKMFNQDVDESSMEQSMHPTMQKAAPEKAQEKSLRTASMHNMSTKPITIQAKHVAPPLSKLTAPSAVVAGQSGDLHPVFQNRSSYAAHAPKKLYRLLGLQNEVLYHEIVKTTDRERQRRPSTRVKRRVSTSEIDFTNREKPDDRVISLHHEMPKASRVAAAVRNEIRLLCPWHKDSVLSTYYSDPSSKFRQKWNLAIFAITIYNLMMIPFRIAYQDSDTTEELVLWISGWTVMDFALDMMLMLDIYFRAFVFGYREKGEVILLPADIYKRYSRTWLASDAVICFPLEIFVVYAPFPAFFRFNRVFGVIHLSRLFSEFDEFLMQQENTALRSASVRVVRVFGMIVLAAHMIGCVWFTVSYTHTKVSPFEGAWITTPNMLVSQAILDAEFSLLQRNYIRSTYYASASLSTVGYGDIACQNYWETAVNIIIVLVSAVCFTSLAGMFDHYLEEIDEGTAKFERTVTSFGIYAKARGIPLDLYARIIKYYEYSQTETSDGSAILEDIPKALREQLAMYIHRDVIHRVHAFQRYSKEAKSQLAAELQAQIFFPNYLIIQEGATGDEMYFIESGFCKVYNNAKTFETLLSPGEYFGETAIVGDRTTRMANVETITRCLIYVLNKEKYLKALERFPDIIAHNEREWGKIIDQHKKMIVVTKHRLPAVAVDTKVKPLPIVEAAQEHQEQEDLPPEAEGLEVLEERDEENLSKQQDRAESF